MSLSAPAGGQAVDLRAAGAAALGQRSARAMAGSPEARAPWDERSGSEELAATERALIVPRALVGAGLAAVSFVIPSLTQVGVLAVGLLLAGFSVGEAVYLRRPRPEGRVLLLGHCSIAAAAFAAAAAGVEFGATPTGPGAILFPFLAFELAYRYRLPGMVVGVSLLLAAISLRLAVRVSAFNLGPRPELILVLLTATLAFLSLAYALRAADARAAEAVRQRGQIAGAFRAALLEILNESGVNLDGAERKNLEELISIVCTHRPDAGPEVGRRLANILGPGGGDPLTRREREILSLAATGVPDSQIAARLVVSPATVRVHIANVVHKLGAESRQEAITLARQRRLLRA